jgi:hypothetical protein
MSMIGNFRMSTDEEIRSLLADPGRIEAVLYSDETPGVDSNAEFDRLKQFLQQARDAGSALIVYLN